MGLDYYAELHGAAMETKDGASFHNVGIKGHWGIAAGVNDAGSFLRVFDVTQDDLQGLGNKGLGAAGKLDSLSGNHHDLPLPAGVDPDMVSGPLMEHLQRQGAYSGGEIEMRGSRALLGVYGVSDNAAHSISERRSYGEVCGTLQKQFGPEGPSAFADKPLKHASVLALVKMDLGAATVPDFSYSAAKAPQSGPAQHTTTLHNIARKPSAF